MHSSFCLGLVFMVRRLCCAYSNYWAPVAVFLALERRFVAYLLPLVTRNFVL